MGVANASTKTEKKIAAEKVEIEVKERQWIRCFPEKEDFLYQTVLCEKDRQGRDGSWKGESKEDP